MKLNRTFSFAAALALAGAGIFPAAAQQPPPAVTTAPVFVPDLSHAGGLLPDGVIAWDSLLKTADATNGQDFARFTFSFTNIAKTAAAGLVTNVTSVTNLTVTTNENFWSFLPGKKITRVERVASVTNIVPETSLKPMPVTILSVHPSCGCTTAELPPVPWTIPPGQTGQIKLSVNLAGKSGALFKTVNVATDQGSKTLTLRINILPPPPQAPMTADQLAQGIAAAKVDRQAVFKGDCATCHLPKVAGKYGQPLFAAVCTICHEAEHRATMVPDLHNLTVPTNVEFWRTWITAGKPGSLMPAFATSQGGPLDDMQIASLAAYLDSVYPSHAAAPALK